jgi:phage tail sheath protein FI
MYKHPGVYIEHVPSGSLIIEAASTSVAAFIGQVKRGQLVTADKDAGEPTFIANVGQFAEKFGELNDGAGGIRDEDQTADYFGHAVNAFFANGGTKAYIVPVGDGSGDAATASLVDPNDATMAFYFTAGTYSAKLGAALPSAGEWANDLFAEIVLSVDDADPLQREYSINLGVQNEKGEIEPIETFDGVTVDPTSGRFLVSRVNDGSALVSVEHLPIAGAQGGGQTSALLSASLGGLDFASITNADSLLMTVDQAAPFSITLDAVADLDELAAKIQQEVRDNGPGTDGTNGFVAQATKDNRLLFLSGGTVAAPRVLVAGGATAARLGLDPTVFRGGEVPAVNEADLDGGTIDIDAGGTQVSVTLAAPLPDLAAVATQIQTQVQGGGVADFRAAAENSRLLLRIDGGDAADAVAVTGGSATADLVLDNAQGATAGRPGVLAYPQPFDTVTNSAASRFAGGTDHGTPQQTQYAAALLRLRDYRDISILLLPAQHWIESGDNSIIQTAIGHAEFMKNAMVVVDPPNPVGGAKLETPNDVKSLGVETSPYAALYYPWLEVSNPHFDPDTAANKPKTFAIPPSGAAAGMWARIDTRRGVWKAPAGLEATVRGSIGPNVLIGNDLQDNLNEWGVNCLRAIIGPTVIWGARTLATKSKPEFRYVPVRRTQNMIGESLYRALQAVVFEPNDHKLWAALRASVGNFMDGLHRAGAFQGQKASDAYFVRCGLDSTMTQGDIDAGIVRVVVGFAPLKPAEFVVVQIKQIVGQQG